MIFELRLALRFLRARRRSLARFTAAAAVIGIGAGVAGLVIAQALGHGFQKELQKRVIGSNSHISIFRSDGSEIEEDSGLRALISGVSGVRRVDATTFESVVITGNNGSSHAVLRVLPNGKDGADSILVGSHLAQRLGLADGDEADILTIAKGGIGARARVRVTGLLETGLYENDASWIAVTEEGYKYKFGGGTFTPQVLSVFVEDPDEAATAAAEIAKSAGGAYIALSWQEANRPLFAAMTLERRVATGVILLIILIAALNITTTLALLVSERRLDIAVLRTCGAKTKSLVAIFLAQGLMLGSTGIVFGLLLGFAGCTAINYFGLIDLPGDVYSISSVTLQPSSADAAAAALGVLAICLLASAYPAYRGSAVKPLDNFRV